MEARQLLLRMWSAAPAVGRRWATPATATTARSFTSSSPFTNNNDNNDNNNNSANNNSASAATTGRPGSGDFTLPQRPGSQSNADKLGNISQLIHESLSARGTPPKPSSGPGSRSGSGGHQFPPSPSLPFSRAAASGKPSASAISDSPFIDDIVRNVRGVVRTTNESAQDIDVPLRLTPALGRSVDVNPRLGRDITRAFRIMEMRCSANRVKVHERQQKFHVRRGQRRKDLRRERWRRLFKGAFKQTVARCEMIRTQGW